MPSEPVNAPASAPEHTRLPPRVAWGLIVMLGAGIWVWRPGEGAPGVSENGWRLLAVFLPCILALMLQPIPGGAAVLIALIATVLVGALDLSAALGGYMDPSVWLVLAAYFIARAFINTGLARRIALVFIRRIGGRTLGLSYALVASDTVLAGMIPSNAARVGGVMLPITRSLAELYNSFPGPSAALLGRFLILSLYQAGVVACALFFTGQASNPLAAKQAELATQHLPGGPVILSYGNWLLYALAPALVSLLIVPWLVYRWERPQLTHTPEAVVFASNELSKMGPPERAERWLMGVFVGVCGLWIIGGAGYITLVALVGVAILLLLNIITWDDVTRERGAWDVFIWYGGLVQLGKKLNETGLLSHYAQTIASGLESWNWLPLFVAMLLIYFYAHYAFASITTHIVSMYPAFVPILLAAGAPPTLTVCAFAFFANFAAGLTHYGTTPGPILFSTGYVSQRTWWKIGFRASLVNVAVWLTIGMAWWKLLGLW